ncbi:centrosomal protein CCDC61 isoform X3 [Calonectris borealis]|uniref:centrosomal protein CCDC61 isoform X3 n=1 Tax=Calonectris borealis TaxID=1323832 RepID=UPI003F4B1CD8
MGEPRYLQADYAFRHGGHAVRLTLSRSALEVEVEAHLTADQWRGEFDAAFIEDLTHKTGNFKQFGIFCSMLESALMQSSESVSLELLTYADLETLRNRKAGAIARPPASAASPLSAKRYLILVYSVEFDRIHYPLPLPYAGKPDPAALRRLVRELREELAQLRARRGEDRRDAEIRRLRDELQRALEEKRAAEAALRREPAGGTAAEATALRRTARRLEDELLREKARHQREHRQLAAEAPARRVSTPPPSSGTGSAGRRRSSSKTESFWSRRSAASSGSEADERSESLPPRGRRVTRTRRPLSASSCNGPGAAPRPAAGHKPPAGSATSKRPGKENCYEEPSAELAEIDARLRALQEYMESLDTRT